MKALRLSLRESELIVHACAGYSIAEMSQRMGISQHTTHTYRGRLYSKLDARNLAEVVAIVFATHVMISRRKLGDDNSIWERPMRA
jgi:DNA-binding CsgD family transcriptional regulator